MNEKCFGKWYDDDDGGGIEGDIYHKAKAAKDYVALGRKDIYTHIRT